MSPPQEPQFFLVVETTFKNFNRQYPEKKLRNHQPDILLIELSREGPDGFGDPSKTAPQTRLYP